MKQTYTLIAIIASILLVSHIAFSAMPVIKVNETDLVNIRVEAVDLDKDSIEYSYSKPLNSSGQWQTGYGDYGEYLVNVSAFDGNLKTTQRFKLIVEKVNWPPAVDDIEDIIIDEGDSLIIDIDAEDEEGDSLDIDMTGPFNASFGWTSDYDDAGVYPIQVTVSDGKHTVIKEFEVKVNNINRIPIIDSYSPLTEDIEMKEGESVSFIVEAEDPDYDQLTYTWEVDCEEQKVETEEKCTVKEVDISEDSCETEIQEIEVCEESGLSKNEFRYNTDYDSAGNHEVKVKISDGEDIVVQKWNVEVENTNRAPVLEDFEDIIVDEGDLVTLEIDAEDPDGDKIFYSITLPIGDDKEWQTDYDDAGEYEIDITISDGDISVSKPVRIIVVDVDRPPEIREIPDIEINETDKVIITMKAEDPDGDNISFSVEGLPENAQVSGNRIVFKSSYDTILKPKTWYVEALKFLRLDDLFYSRKEYDINVKASGKEKYSEQRFTLAVNNKNRAPVIMPIDTIVVNETEKVEISPKIIEYDNDRVSFSISDPIKRGEWQTDYDDSGVYSVEITAFDGKMYDTENVTLIVNNLNRPPVIEPISPRFVKEDELVWIRPEVTDPDGQDVELALEEAPVGAQIDNNTFGWIPPYDTTIEGVEKDVMVTFSATDPEGWQGFADALITVINKNQPPIIYNVSPVKNISVKTGEPAYFLPSVIDLDEDNLTYEWRQGNRIISDKPAIKRTFIYPGEKEITFRVSDGKSTKRYTWDVYVSGRTKKVVPAVTKKTVVKKSTVVSQPSRMLVYTIENKVEEDKSTPSTVNAGTVNTEVVEVYKYSEPSTVPPHMKHYEIG